jgi:primosomal protein N' (replication factor Y)
MASILRVALPVPLPQLFDYLPPATGDAQPGSRVRVPFGRGRQVGMVVAQAGESAYPPEQLKHVEKVLDDAPLFDAELLASVHWAADYWLGAPGEAFLGALPVMLRGDRALPPAHAEAWALSHAGQAALAAGTRRGRSRELLQALADSALAESELDASLPGWRAAGRRLLAAGLLQREPLTRAERAVTVAAPTLGNEQRAAADAVLASSGGFEAFLLDGVTGSGKTEVYLALIERALAQGRQSLLLVPEIGLAPQALKRLTARFGVAVEVLHSNLAEGDRARAWLRAREGSAKVIVGTRSAVFTPLPHAGLVIVDEEHDASYKQQEGFRYHARDLAVVRARALGVPVVLGSATPSLESLANVEAGRYRHLRLTARPLARPAPTVRVLDLRGTRAQHGLSPALLGALDECIARGEQALVFRNRRGYAPVLLCRACGWHAGCERCDRPLTLHEARARLVCHHCGHQQAAPRACPQCGYGELHRRGFGTERLEETLAARYPDVPVIRVDSETTRRRDAFEQLLGKLDHGGAAILVGTQMLAKGHDLPDLTLVAITGVDEGLYSIDFRAGEKLAQLIVQVAGRAGRAARPGTVILQTHLPEHPLLTTLLQRGYGALAAQLLEERRALKLPPCAHQALLRAQAPQAAMLQRFLDHAAATLPGDEALRVYGPLPAPMPLRAGQHRGQVLVEADQRAVLRQAIVPWHAHLSGLRTPRALRWSLDVDPVDLY